jgi:2-hydroxy-3-keto-5-methylthiopentenyl-1-phosphate phosphatase
MAPMIRAVLSNLLGEQANEIEIIANDVNVKSDGEWEIKYRHPTRWALGQQLRHFETEILDLIHSPSGFGHDKSQAILHYRNLPSPPTLFFFGDGVSGKFSIQFTA